MTTETPDPRHDRPPLVMGTLMDASSHLGGGLRWTLAALGRRAQMWVWAGGTIAVFAGIVTLSIAQSPDLSGMASGVVLGLFMALLFAAAMGWLLLWARGPRAVERPDTSDAARTLDALLAPTLTELNAVRTEVMRVVKQRSLTRVPIGIAGGFALWLLDKWSDDPSGMFGLPVMVAVGAIAGELWAMASPQRDYTRLYKSRVLPQLAAQFGDLSYQQASHDVVHRLRAQRILPECDAVEADDEIAGTYRQLPLSIVEARLRQRSGDSSRTVFDGLLLELTLPRALSGTTVVLADAGPLANLKARWRSDGMTAVRIDDPEFERRYEVYGSDQVEARALLTPAFMSRFLALASRSGFSLPGAMAIGNRLIIALPKGVGMGDLFEPPVFWKPAGGEALVTLTRDIRAVLATADAVIDLDFWARGPR